MKFRLRTLFMATLLCASVLMGVDNARMRRLTSEAQEREEDAQRAVTIMQRFVGQCDLEIMILDSLQYNMVDFVASQGHYDVARGLERLVRREKARGSETLEKESQGLKIPDDVPLGPYTKKLLTGELSRTTALAPDNYDWQAKNRDALTEKEEQAEKVAREQEVQKEQDRLRLPEAPLFPASPETVKLDRPVETDAPSAARSYFENDELAPLPED